MLGQGNFGHGVVSYLLVMFFIWWTWVNFAWLSSSFEVDDWLYRSLAAIQMLGVLVVAGGVEQTFGGTVNVALIGYITIRAAQIGQWARASRCGGPAGRAALIYAVGIAVLAVLWVVCALWVPFLALPLVVGELAVPIIAAIPLAYLVGQSWCAWAYHKGRSPKIIMVANYFSIIAALVPMAPVGALLLSPSATQVVLNYLWSSPLLVPLTVMWILIELPIETVFSLFYARRSGRRLSIMAEASAA